MPRLSANPITLCRDVADIPALKRRGFTLLFRKKFDKYVPLETRLTFLHRYRSLALFLPITQNVADCRDPKDNQFLDIALAASAHYLITGDPDLLVLHPYHHTQIIAPADFLALI